MPPKPRWYKNLRRIRAAVERLGEPLLDRHALEKLLGVRARRAQQILALIGGSPIGSSLAVPRERVLSWLDATARGEPYRAEEARRRRVGEALEEARQEFTARRVRFRVPRRSGQTVAGLPDSIHLESGELRIACKDAQDLLEQLYLLSRMIAKDYAAFEMIVRPKD